MFWALNGATFTPCRANQRQMPATTTLFPASEWVPATSMEPLAAVLLLLARSHSTPKRSPSPAQKASCVPSDES